MNNNLNLQILRLKKEKNAVILAHYYQLPEIQDIADFVGDSLGLSQKASETEAEIIVFAGVHFMAETAKIINPHKKVILPDINAGCSLADSCTEDKFRTFLTNFKGYTIISYINCSAEVKALSDIIVTSGNAVQIIESLPKDEKIVFAPDKNLGAYINSVTGRNMVLWDGTCTIHDILKAEEVIKLKLNNPGAKLISHPECNAALLEISDFIGSTTAMIKFIKNDQANKYIVATETGILHQMKKTVPEKDFIIVPSDEKCSCNDCKYMKMNTIEKLYDCLLNEKPEINLPEELMNRARKPIERMLELSKNLKLIK
jgi:quinolinate synthase